MEEEQVKSLLKGTRYTRDDIVTAGSGRKGPITVMELDRIDLMNSGSSADPAVRPNQIKPSLMENVEKEMRAAGSAYSVITDGSMSFLFAFEKGKLVEIPSLPIINVCCGESIVPTDDDIRRCTDLKSWIRTVSASNGRMAFLAVGAAVMADRDGMWGELEKGLDDYEGSWRNLYTKMYSEYGDQIGSVRMGSGEDRQFRMDVLRARNLNLSHPSVLFGQILIESLSGRDSIGMKGEALDELLSFIDDGGMIITRNPCEVMVRAVIMDRRIRIHPIGHEHDQMLRICGSLMGKGTELIDTSPLDRSMKTLVVDTGFVRIPEQFDAGDMDDRMFHSRTNGVEEALELVREGGRVVALVPSSFLFGVKLRKLREYLRTNYHVEGIVIMDRPFESTHINCALVSVVSEEPGRCVVSREPVSDYGVCGIRRSMRYILSEGGSSDGFFVVDQSQLPEEWTPSRIWQYVHPVKGNPLSDYCEIIRSDNRDRSPGSGPSFGGLPYVTPSDIRDGCLDVSGSRKMLLFNVKTMTMPRDILISVRGAVGKVALVGDVMVAPSPYMAILRPKDGVDSGALFAALNSSEFQEQLRNLSGGSYMISLKDLADARVDGI